MIVELIVALVAAVGLALVVSKICGLYLVQGISMLPGLLEGDWVLACRYLWRKPRVGEVVILKWNSLPPVLIKRVLARPNECVPAEVCLAQCRLPEGHYLLASDNSSLRPEYRWVGPVAREQIWGRAVVVVGPHHRIKLIRALKNQVE